MVAYGKHIKKNNNLGTRDTFADIAATVMDYFDLEGQVAGNSFLKDIISR